MITDNERTKYASLQQALTQASGDTYDRVLADCENEENRLENAPPMMKAQLSALKSILGEDLSLIHI